MTGTGTAWGDKDDEWTERINAAHPLKTGDNETYGIAMRMVGNRHSKGALVELVNWLLKSPERQNKNEDHDHKPKPARDRRAKSLPV
jgi:hypothetical protein